jgi:hypothetical protein
MVVVCVLVGACATDPPELEIAANQAPVEDTCELSQVRTGRAIPSGTFDLAIGDRSSYVLTPLVRNNGTSDLTIRTARLEAYEEVAEGSIRLNFACEVPEGCQEWDIDLCAGGACPVIEPGGTASFEVQALPRVVTGYYQLMMDAAVRSGRVPPEFELRSVVRLIAGDVEREVVSAAFSFGIRLCLGCLVEFPEGTDSPGLPEPDCCGPGTPVTTCYPGQDGPIDCRSCLRTLPEICNFGRVSCGS